MKKIVLLILLFISMRGVAQHLYFGGTIIGTVYYEMPAYNSSKDWAVDLSAQLIFKNDKMGIEANALSFANGDPIFEGGGVFDYTINSYYLYNLFRSKSNVLLQVKGGIFLSKFNTEGATGYNSNYYNYYNYGPALGISLSIPVSKRAYFSFDISQMFGIASITPRSQYTYEFDYPNNIVYSYLQTFPSTHLFYTCYMIKFIHKIF